VSGVEVTWSGQVGVVTLNRPERRNALDLQDRKDLIDALKTVEREARAIVLFGAGPAFCAGGDLASMPQEEGAARERLTWANELATRLINGRRPVVAAVEGAAFGLGLALAMASDLVVAGRSARFCTAFAKVGLGPDTGIAYSLPRRVGPSRAKELILTARVVPADLAHSYGMVDEVVDDTTALVSAVDTATRLALMSAPMLEGARDIMGSQHDTLADILDSELQLQVKLLAGEDFAEGRSAFLDGRPAQFRAI
jgi:2-(1,2-epoxy-1,2-dihydrophenyl)acetyl-CoA isomerase